MQRIALACLILAVSLALALPALAQSDASLINFCAGELSYDLPDGWVADDPISNPYALSQRFATHESLLKDESPETGQAVAIVTVLARRSLTLPMRIDTDADLRDILAGVIAQVSSPFTAEAIMPISVQDQPTAQVVVHAQALDMLMLALDLDSDTAALVAFSAPTGEIEQWEETALGFAVSLAFNAPRHERRHWRETALAAARCFR